MVTIATDEVLFPSGSAVLQTRGKKILTTLMPTLKNLPNRISVDGHTDSVPISTNRYPSNWELSTDRATGVLRFLTPKIPVGRISATGYADTRPLRAGNSKAARAANRRVEIVVLASVDNAEGRAIAALANPTRATSSSSADTSSSTPDGSSH